MATSLDIALRELDDDMILLSKSQCRTERWHEVLLEWLMIHKAALNAFYPEPEAQQPEFFDELFEDDEPEHEEELF